MDKNHKYTVEEVLEIVLTLKPEERIQIQKEIQKSILNEQEILDRMNPIHEKYKETYKNNLLLDDPEIEQLVKEDFAKYEATFKALS